MSDGPFVTDSAGILFVLAANAALWFFLERRYKWKLFQYVPPLLFIYILPVVFSNAMFTTQNLSLDFRLIPNDSPLYDWMGSRLLPFFIALLLLDVDVRATIRVMGSGVFVMLIGTAGVVVGAPIGFWFVSGHLGPEAWRAYGALAGSWIGGTGNMSAVWEGLTMDMETVVQADFGLAVIADNAVYLVWLPILLQSKHAARWFHRFTGVSDDRLDRMKSAADELVQDKGTPQMAHYLYLIAIGFGVASLSTALARLCPPMPPVLSEGTYAILLTTTFALFLSFTPARKIPGSHALAMALVYLFVARMGAKTSLEGVAGQALPFIGGAFIWIFIHGVFIIVAARIFHIDVHTTAIASAANIGGAASAPIVAAYHDERLVPVAILMALIGYAVGNYAAILAAWLCHLTLAL